MLRQTVLMLLDSDIEIRLFVILSRNRCIILNTELMIISIFLTLKLLKFLCLFVFD